MDPGLFDRVIGYLGRRFRIVSLEDLVLNPARYAGEPERPLCTVGFDDGYKDNVTHAAPVLRRHGCPASFYVVTDSVDEGRPIWTYALDQILSSSGMALDEARALKADLKTLPHDERARALEDIQNRYGAAEPPKGLMMGWDDVRTLVREGFTVGSHSRTHSMLGTMSSRSMIREELTVSRDVIVRETGRTPLAISYPIGSLSETVIEEAKASGYRLGLATGQTAFELETGCDPFRIPRIELYNESWLKTKLRIDGVIERVKKWLRR